jgi:hypothetical protein
MMANHALRVLAIVSNKSSAWKQSPDEIIRIATQVINEADVYEPKRITLSDTKLLAIQRYLVREMFVFDIWNEDYDPEKGHLPEQNQLPVIVIHLSDRTIVSKPHPGECTRINENIRYLHDANGVGSLPPFIENHTSQSPPNYPNPRSLKNSGTSHRTP